MSDARADSLGLSPESCVRGVFRPGGSKSLAQRALLAAAVARGETRLVGLSADGGSENDDVRAALALVQDLGVTAERVSAEELRVIGMPPTARGGLVPRATLAVGESGTLARLATALVALASAPGSRWTIGARGSLLFRKSTPLFAALQAAGVEIGLQNLPGTWPVALVAVQPPATLELVRPLSSQEVSGLVLALAAHPERRTLTVRGRIPSAPYLRMTEGLVRLFRAQVTSTRAGAGADELELVLEVQGPLIAPGAALVLEPDASSAAVLLAAACLSGGELRVPGLTRASAQGDVRIVEHLAAFGCDARFESDSISARGAPTRGAELDLGGEPDLAPVLAAVAACAALRGGAVSVLSGLGTLPGKESDRLSVLARGLEACGCVLEVRTDALRIAPGTVTSGTLVLDPHGDHRMAFAFALLGLLRSGIRVADPGCVAKSWANFWLDLERLGAQLERA